MSCDPEDHERVIAQHFAHIDEHQKEHKRRAERIADLEATLTERDKELEECKGMFTREAQFATAYSDANVDLHKRLAERDRRVAQLAAEDQTRRSRIADLEAALRDLLDHLRELGGMPDCPRCSRARQTLNDPTPWVEAGRIGGRDA